MQLSIEDEIEKIVENPALGETKKGALQGFRVHKFAFKNKGAECHLNVSEILQLTEII